MIDNVVEEDTKFALRPFFVEYTQKVVSCVGLPPKIAKNVTYEAMEEAMEKIDKFYGGKHDQTIK